MAIDTDHPFRGSDAVRRGALTWGVLTGPAFRHLGADTYVGAGVADSPLLRVRALLVRGGPDAVATGWSACLALGLDVAPRAMPAEISAPDRRLDPMPGTTVWRQRIPADERTVRDGVPTTTPVRTAFDLARRAGPDRWAVDRLVGPLTDAVAAADALARLGFTADELTAFTHRHPGLRGVRRVPHVAALLDPRPDSRPESRLRVKLVLAGLPRPLVRWEVRDALGMMPRELDLAWPRYRVAVEYDGHDHALADRRGRDVDRLDALRRDGWIVIVVTASQLARPQWVPDRVREALIERGWVPGPNPWAAVVAENAALAHRMPRSHAPRGGSS